VFEHDAAGEDLDHDLEDRQREIRDEDGLALNTFTAISGDGEFHFLDHPVVCGTLDEWLEPVEKSGFLKRLDVEENNDGVAKNYGKTAAPGFEGEGRGCQAAGLAQRTGIDIPADTDRADMNLVPTIENFR